MNFICDDLNAYIYIFMKNLNVIRFPVVDLIFYVDINFFK